MSKGKNTEAGQLNKACYRESVQHGSRLFPIAMYEGHFTPDSLIPMGFHWHEELEFTFLTEGSADFQIEDMQVPLEKGEILLIKAGVIHGIHERLPENMSFRAIVVHYEFIAGIGKDIIWQKYLEPVFDRKNGKYLRLGKEQENTEKLFQILNRIYEIYRQKDEAYELLLKSMMYQVFYELHFVMPEGNGQNHDRAGSLMRRIYQYVEENYGEKINLGTAAKAVHLSEGYFCRFFKQNFHMTFLEYVNGVRLREAERLVRTTGDTMEEIAGKTGFASSNYFTVCFRRHFHMTPSRYRREHGLEIGQDFNKIYE